MELFLYWLHLICSYIAPAGLLFYTFVIENILNKEVTVMTKLGAGGIFVLAVCIIICIVVFNKLFTKREQKFEKLSIKEIDLKKREEYILKWSNTEKYHNIFKQGIMLAVLVMITLLVGLLESKLIALRGTMTTLCILYGVGMIFYSMYQNVKQKNLGSKEQK